MVKIIKSNTITPKKKPLRKWGYSRVNGGEIYKFNFPESESAIKRMEEECTNNNKWNRYPGPNPHGRGDRNYTIITIIPNYECLKVHSVYFPNGMVWDSSIRDFRPIRDYEKDQ
jgi:hypothetical protein